MKTSKNRRCTSSSGAPEWGTPPGQDDLRPNSNRPQSAFSKFRLGAISALCCTGLIALLGVPAERLTLPGGSYVYPVVGPRVSSQFGLRNHPVLRAVRHHRGVDLAAPSGALIRAIQEGRVVFADPHGSYGNLIVIQHANGLTSHYGHCESIRVTIGERVLPGQIIGTVGQTGRVTGPHLHLEIRKNGVPLNPERFIPDLAQQGEG